MRSTQTEKISSEVDDEEVLEPREDSDSRKEEQSTGSDTAERSRMMRTENWPLDVAV